MKRNRKKQTKTLSDRLQKFAGEARRAAERLPAGRERDELLRKAELAEEAQASEWVTSPALQLPIKQ